MDHGPAGEDWTDNVRSVIEARMMKYTQGEIQFNLMGIIQDKTIRYMPDLIFRTEFMSEFRYNSQLKSISGMSIDSQMAEVARIEMLLAEEENKRAKWKQENIRRRHNYLPLIMEMLRCLAERDELLPIYNKAKEKTIELEKKKKEKKAAAKL